MLSEAAELQSKSNFFAKPFVWVAAKKTSVCNWWKGICGNTQLSKIACRILSLPPTSAAVERSFSKHAFIHTSKRNRLTNERAFKLTYISNNLKYQTPAQQQLPKRRHLIDADQPTRAESTFSGSGSAAAPSAYRRKIALNADTTLDDDDFESESDSDCQYSLHDTSDYSESFGEDDEKDV